MIRAHAEAARNIKSAAVRMRKAKRSRCAVDTAGGFFLWRFWTAARIRAGASPLTCGSMEADRR